MGRFRIFLLITVISWSFADDLTRIDLEIRDLGQVSSAAFSISQACDVRIVGKTVKGLLSEGHSKGVLIYDGWILNSSTRELVWGSNESTEEKKSVFLEENAKEFEETIRLKPGDYEVYFVGLYTAYYKDKWKQRLVAILPKILKPENEKNIKNLEFTVEGPAQFLHRRKLDLDHLIPGEIVAIHGVGNHTSEAKSFTVKERTKLKIYALGEGLRRDGGIYDYGWITDVDHHTRVWTMTVRNSVYAGGHEKNILVRDSIVLNPGHYELHYVSDDSHSTEHWNADPPYDPLAWGITLSTEDPSQNNRVVDIQRVKCHDPFLQLIQVGNSAYLSRGFMLKKDLEIHIQCVGERDSSGTLVDYGWIVDAHRNERVWSMAQSETQHAGGAYKNRIVDDFLFLKKGSYIAHYRTDDSHAFGSWNSSPPYNGDNWGMILWTRNPEDQNAVVLFDASEYKNKGLIEKIVRAQNYQFTEKPFHLEKDALVRVQAIGEGTQSDGMVDFGWIENEDSGEVIWNMTFEQTEPAGGAKKNRKIQTTLNLKAGDYKLCYETDGSHAWNSWNDDPPEDPEDYGIMLFVVKKSVKN